MSELVLGQPTILISGREVEHAGFELSASEDLAGWTVDVTLTRPTDFARVSVGAAVEIRFFGRTYFLVVDTTSFDRKAVSGESLDPIGLRITAVSPIARTRPPFSKVWTSAGDAHAVVEEVLEASVVWTSPDWTIPAEQLAADLADRLDLAKRIVQAAGGVIEQTPEGLILCRPKHRVRVPDYPTVEPAHVVSDVDIMSIAEEATATEIVNRLIVEDGDAAQGPSLTWTADENDGMTGTLRAAVAADPAPGVTLDHCGGASLSVASSGLVSRVETETVEIVAGLGEVSFPVWGITSAVWKHRDLGAVRAFEPGSKRLTAQATGASLLAVSYITRAWEWRARDSVEEAVLFAGTEDGAGTSTLRVDFSSSSGVTPGETTTPHISVMIDSRPAEEGGLNGGKTSFQPGDTVWCLVFAHNVGVAKIAVSAGGMETRSAGPVTITEDLTFGGGKTATLSVPADAVSSLSWLGSGLGDVSLGADRVTFTASWAGAGALRVVFTATPVRAVGIKLPLSLGGGVDFPVDVAVIGDDE